MQNVERQFSTGSRDTQDTRDQYLDDLGYYRKHVARDSSSLFRVISEQLYNAQIHHGDIREICVDYMTLHRSRYEKYVESDSTDSVTYDEYLMKLSKASTPGTLLELRALAYRFKRNVVLFDAYTAGEWFVHERDFNENFMVFHHPVRHFDSVFSKPYIELVAFCQSITYEILYSRVFKLPDIVYAVERMLHDPDEAVFVRRIEISPYDDSHESITLSDGRYFVLDRADATECIMESYLLCHFHNKKFGIYFSQLEKDRIRLQDEPGAVAKINEIMGALLPKKNVSCVRQLLDENITPFPYKVAKALDDHIYRNIEFDVWDDTRKLSRHKKYLANQKLQPGTKCHIYFEDTNTPYFCHIQNINADDTCDVFIEKLGARKTVPMSDVKPIPHAKLIVPRVKTYHKKKRVQDIIEHLIEIDANLKISMENLKDNYDYLCQPLHIPQQYCEYVAAPYVQFTSNRSSKKEENGNVNGTNNKSNMPKKQNPVHEPKVVKNETSNVVYENSNPDINNALPIPFTSNAPPNIDFEFDPNFAGQNYNHQSNYMHMINTISKRRDVLHCGYPINVNVMQSVDPTGADLPYTDTHTLRFFFNFGHECFNYFKQNMLYKTMINQLHICVKEPNVRLQRGMPAYDNSGDMDGLTNDFTRNARITTKDPYGNKLSEGNNYNQNRRQYTGNSAACPKKNGRKFGVEFNKNKRPFDTVEPSKQSYYKGQSEHQTGIRNVESLQPTILHSDGGITPQYYQMYPPPQPFMPYQPIENTTEQPNAYSPPYHYGMYPPENYSYPYPYHVQTPNGMVFVDPACDENDWSSTYPYCNQPPGPPYYFSHPMTPYGMPQGWIQQIPPPHTMTYGPCVPQNMTPVPNDTSTNNNNKCCGFSQNEA